MISMRVKEEACRGCELCVDVCPTKVLGFDAGRHKAVVLEPGECIGCLSCSYLCPAQALHHEGVPLVRNFYRDSAFIERTERFL